MAGYVHIGAPKCGSTALQSVIKENIDYLSEKGIRTPKTQNFSNELAHRFVQGWKEVDELKASISQKEHYFDPAGGDILLSSEAFLACAQDREDLDHLIKLMHQNQLHILGVIRDPASLLESTWFQWMRTYRTFPKVRESMRRNGLYFRNYLERNWFEGINNNWQAWKNHPSVSSFKEVRMGLEHFDPVEVIGDFIGHPIPLMGKKTESNESINGVTFRILKEWRGIPINGYNNFVAQLEKATREKGYGKYRFLSNENARKVNESAVSLPLFADFADWERDRPTAQDIPPEEFRELQELSQEIARPFLSENVSGLDLRGTGSSAR